MIVSNWDKWQSFRKDRGAPPWIKVHRNLFTNGEWVTLTDAEKGQLVSIWMLAADKGGEIPDNPELVRRMAMLEHAPDLDKFYRLGFITDEECSPQDSDDGEEEGKIYFIQQQDAVKIGFSKNPWARLAQLKVGMPYVATLLFHVVATKSQEQATHELFKKHRLEGEWFSICPEILAYIRNCEETGELLTSYPQPVVGLPDAPDQSRVETETETETEKQNTSSPPAGLDKIDSKKDLPPKKPKEPPTGPMHPELFEEFKAAYPKAANRHNWTVGWKKWNARINLNVEPAALIAGARKYSNHMDRTEKTGTVYILNPGTFLGPNEYYLQDWGSDELKSAGFDLDALLLATGHPT